MEDLQCPMTPPSADPPDDISPDDARDMLVATDLSRDDVYSILADHFRRVALYYLVYEADGGITPDELTEYLRTTADAETTRKQSLQTRLHHTVLPCLQDHGLIDYDTRSEMIRYRGHPQLEAVLARAQQIERGDSDNGQNER